MAVPLLSVNMQDMLVSRVCISSEHLFNSQLKRRRTWFAIHTGPPHLEEAVQTRDSRRHVPGGHGLRLLRPARGLPAGGGI